MTSLSESALLRYIAFTLLYFAQGIPQGLLMYSLPAWFAMNGISPGAISGFIAVIALPWSLKIIAAPFTDRFAYLPMGRRKPWLLFGQIGLTAGLVGLAFVPNPLSNLPALMVIGFLSSLFGVFQDVSTDGMAIDLLPRRQHARANGLMWGAKILGIAATVALCSFLIDSQGYFWAMISLAAILSLIMLVPVFMKERSCEKRFPWSRGKADPEAIYWDSQNWRAIVRSLLQVIFLPASLAMGFAALCLSIGSGLMDAILPVFTVQNLNWTDVDYSSVFSTTNLITGVLAMAVAGLMIDFWGKRRMISLFAILMFALTVSMALFHEYWATTWFVKGFFILFYALDTFATVAIFAIAMQLCWKRIAATQFALYMAVSNIGISFGAWLMGQLKTHFGWDVIFLSYAGLMILALVGISLMNLQKHAQQVDLLMSNFLDERIKNEALRRRA
ncbi:MFS transporter [Mangrovibacterium diazotrophicum]|nr:MFS transporter [Mangrovibacterium diazotrophicum]